MLLSTNLQYEGLMESLIPSKIVNKLETNESSSTQQMKEYLIPSKRVNNLEEREPTSIEQIDK